MNKITLPPLPEADGVAETDVEPCAAGGYEYSEVPAWSEPLMQAYATLAIEAAAPFIIAEFLEKSGQWVTNDATRDAAIKAVVEADRQARGEPVAASVDRDEVDLLEAAIRERVINTHALPYDAIKPVAINVAARDLDPDLRARLGRLSNVEACALVEYLESRGVRA